MYRPSPRSRLRLADGKTGVPHQSIDDRSFFAAFWAPIWYCTPVAQFSHCAAQSGDVPSVNQQAVGDVALRKSNLAGFVPVDIHPISG